MSRSCRPRTGSTGAAVRRARSQAWRGVRPSPGSFASRSRSFIICTDPQPGGHWPSRLMCGGCGAFVRPQKVQPGCCCPLGATRARATRPPGSLSLRGRPPSSSSQGPLGGRGEQKKQARHKATQGKLMPRPVEHVLLRVAARRSPSTKPPGRGCEGLTDQRKALCQLTSVRASITETAKRRWQESGAPGPCWWECSRAAVRKAAQLFPKP